MSHGPRTSRNPSAPEGTPRGRSFGFRRHPIGPTLPVSLPVRPLTDSFPDLRLPRSLNSSSFPGTDHVMFVPSTDGPSATQSP